MSRVMNSQTLFAATPRLLLAASLVACGPTTADLEARDARIVELERQEEAARRASEARVTALEEENANLRSVIEGLSSDADALTRDREALEARVAEAQDALGSLEADRASLEEDRAGLRSELEDAGAALAETTRALAQVRAREAQAQERLRTFQQMIGQLQAMIDSGQLRVRVVRNQMVVQLPSALLFDTARARIRPNGREVLEQLAPVLASLPGRAFQVGGHTDARPISTQRFPSNWELSSARALTVARFLVEKGLPAERVSAAAYADTQPVASNETEEGRQQNRRTDIVLLPNLEELPDLSQLEAAAEDR